LRETTPPPNVVGPDHVQPNRPRGHFKGRADWIKQSRGGAKTPLVDFASKRGHNKSDRSRGHF